MSTVTQTKIAVNTINSDVGFDWGFEDATEGRDRCGSVYFVANTGAWNAYNDGYNWGCIALAVLTGEPVMGDYRCPICGQHYNPTYGHQCPGPQAYAPFQQPATAYADVMPEWQRDDYVGD